MLTGFLRIFILKHLQESQKSGYELMQEIENKVGKKPSSGSLYPLLKKMHAEGLLKYTTKNNKKYYYLTKKGKELALSLIREKEQLIQTHKNLSKALESTKAPPLPDIENKAFLRNSDVIHEFKKTVTRLMNRKDFQEKEQELRDIIKEATKKLNRL